MQATTWSAKSRRGLTVSYPTVRSATVASNVFYFNNIAGPGQRSLIDPSGLAVDAQGDLFIAETGNSTVWKETPGPDGLLTDGTMALVAGNGFAWEGGPPVQGIATLAPLSGPADW